MAFLLDIITELLNHRIEQSLLSQKMWGYFAGASAIEYVPLHWDYLQNSDRLTSVTSLNTDVSFVFVAHS